MHIKIAVIYVEDLILCSLFNFIDSIPKRIRCLLELLSKTIVLLYDKQTSPVFHTKELVIHIGILLSMENPLSLGNIMKSIHRQTVTHIHKHMNTFSCLQKLIISPTFISGISVLLRVISPASSLVLSLCLKPYGEGPGHQVLSIEYLPGMHEVLTSIPSTT